MSSLQTAAPLPDYRLETTNRTARSVVVDMVPHMELAPPYQRRSVWDAGQRVALVRSWLMGVPVPAVIVNDRSWLDWTGDRADDTDVIWAVVDGKQRIETGMAWFSGNLAVPASWFPHGMVQTQTPTGDGPYVTYTGLTRPAQLRMAHSAMLPVIEAKLPDLAAEAELYLLLNGAGTAQSAEDMARAAAIAARRPGARG